MRILTTPTNDVNFAVVSHGRTVARVIADGRGMSYYCLDGPVSGRYATRDGLMAALQRHYGSGVRLVSGQRRLPRRPSVATGGPTYTATAVKPRPPSGPTGGAPRTGAPTTPGSARSAPGGAGYMLWRFPSTAQPPPMLRPMPVRPALGLSEILPTGSLGSHGILCGGVSKLPPKSDANMTPVARPRPTRRPGGAGTGRRLPR